MLVECAVKYKNPRLFRPGTNYFVKFSRGAHLLAHTWASKAMLQGIFLFCSGIKMPPLMDNFRYYTTKEGNSR